MTQGTPIVQQNDRLSKDPPTSPPTDTAKQNFTAQQIGNDKGHIAFGKIHKQGDVTEGVGLHTPDGEHQLSLDIDGPRKGWTTSTSPGNFMVECGSKIEPIKDSLTLTAHNGNIVIKALNGKIRLEADDIELCTQGNGAQGNVEINLTLKLLVQVTLNVLLTVCCLSMEHYLMLLLMPSQENLPRMVAVKKKEQRTIFQVLLLIR